MMRWATVAETTALIPLPVGYVFEQLDRRQIAELSAKVEQWHPDISVGAGSCFLREEFYLDKVFLANEAEKDVYVLLIKFAGEMVGMWAFDREVTAQGSVKRVFEAVFAKVLVQGDAILRPEPQNLTPRTRLLFEAMFPLPANLSNPS